MNVTNTKIFNPIQAPKKEPLFPQKNVEVNEVITNVSLSMNTSLTAKK
jgi:hypothetical protein